MNENVRSAAMAAAIAVVIAIVMGLVFDMGGGGTVLFALAMGAIAFVGTMVISSIIVKRKASSPPRP